MDSMFLFVCQTVPPNARGEVDGWHRLGADGWVAPCVDSHRVWIRLGIRGVVAINTGLRLIGQEPVDRDGQLASLSDILAARLVSPTAILL